MELYILFLIICIFVWLFLAFGPSNKTRNDKALHFKVDALISHVGIDIEKMILDEVKSKLTESNYKEAVMHYCKLTGSNKKNSQLYVDNLIKNNKP